MRSQAKEEQVGSTDAAQIYNALSLSSNANSGFANMSNHNATIPAYSADGHGFYSRGIQYPPHLDTKSVGYPENWTIPNPEETSPVETYGLDQPTPYVSTPSTLANAYGQGYQWSRSNLRNTPAGVHTCLSQDPPASYTTNMLPYLQPGANRPSNEALSPLNMTSISSALPISLPERLRPHHSQPTDSTMPQRQLPMPQPSPTKSTRNTVDLLQDQRLRSAQIASGNSMSVSSSSAKHTVTWPNDTSVSVSDSQSMESSAASSTDHLPQTTTAASVTDVSNLAGFTPVTASSIKAPVTLPAQPTLNFSTSTLLDTIPTPSSTYSNFRNYALPTSSSSVNPIHVLSRQSSERNLYNFAADNVTKRRSLDEAPSSASLISGHRYTPLGVAPQTASRMRRGSLENRQQVPVNGTSMSNLKRTD